MVDQRQLFLPFFYISLAPDGLQILFPSYGILLVDATFPVD